jgi:hypothetical protein
VGVPVPDAGLAGSGFGLDLHEIHTNKNNAKVNRRGNRFLIGPFLL